jgi:hypothetical protein
MRPCDSILAIHAGEAEKHFFDVLEEEMQLSNMLRYMNDHREELFGHVYAKNDSRDEKED